MSLILDWILIIVTSLIALSSYRRIIRNRYSSVAHFILLIEYIFLSTPILLNYCIGMPTYQSIPWYSVFLSSMTNDWIAIIYDLYILISMVLLYLYAISHDSRAVKYKKYDEIKFDGFFTNKVVLTIVIIAPIIHIIISGQLLSYLIYGTSSKRGIDSSDFVVLQSMILQLSIFAFCYRFFSTSITGSKVFILLAYSLMIAWISGKRFMIALLMLVYLFCFTRSKLEKKTRKRLEKLVPLLFILLLIFSGFYLVIIKPVPDTSLGGIYDVLRVDFGRDDVIKFVIEQEFFKNNPILEYRGQTILSEFLTFVPRFMWPNKPYPHYVYLTSEILGVATNKLPAGTTPSWFEMCIANFSWLGFLIGAIGIPFFCKWCDKTKSATSRLLIMIFIMVLITQSMSAYTVVLLLIVAKGAIKLVLGDRKVVLVFKRRQ